MLNLDEYRATVPRSRLRVADRVWDYVAVGEGPGLVLLHGMAGSADVWFQQVQLLSDRRRVVAVTYPRVRCLEELAVGVMAVADAEGLDVVKVVGTSLGGYLAQYLVKTRPERIAAAVFANTFPPNDLIAERSRLLRRLFRLLPSRLVSRSLLRSARARLVPAGDDSPLLARLLEETYTAPDAKRVFLERLDLVLEPFEAPEPAMPVAIVEAGDDPLVWPELRHALRETYPDAPTYTFESGGHFPYVNRPYDYAEVVEKFLR
ncbi:MAG TPA: alpha/beta hydrolase [Actinobacteria bacterium]|nr:alpha/beta hydrolase [Actinomycetota bacterium]